MFDDMQNGHGRKLMSKLHGKLTVRIFRIYIYREYHSVLYGE